MKKEYFTEEEIIELKKNKFVKTISNKSISFTDEFKELFIEKSNEAERSY